MTRHITTRTRIFLTLLSPLALLSVIAGVFFFSGSAENAAKAFLAASKYNYELSFPFFLALISFSLVMVALCYGAASLIAEPLEEVANIMVSLADGKTKLRIGNTLRRDEIGDIARAATSFRQSVYMVQSMLAEKSGEIAAKEKSKAQMKELLTGFSRRSADIIDNLGNTSTWMASTSHMLKNLALETNQNSSTIAGAASQADLSAKNVEAAARTLLRSSGKISHILNTAAERHTAIENAASKAQEPAQQAGSSAARIEHFAEWISDIADQLSAIAMNTTLEALHNKGEAEQSLTAFAGSIKDLADQTRRASQDLGTLGITAKMQTRHALQTLQRIGGAVKRAGDSLSDLSPIVREQELLATRIARNIREVSQGAAEASLKIVAVNDTTAASSTAAHSVLKVADRVSSQSSSMRAEINALMRNLNIV